MPSSRFVRSFLPPLRHLPVASASRLASRRRRSSLFGRWRRSGNPTAPPALGSGDPASPPSLATPSSSRRGSDPCPAAGMAKHRRGCALPPRSSVAVGASWSSTTGDHERECSWSSTPGVLCGGAGRPPPACADASAAASPCPTPPTAREETTADASALMTQVPFLCTHARNASVSPVSLRQSR